MTGAAARLVRCVDSFGERGEPDIRVARNLAEWFAHAEDRPAWLLWGKAHPDRGGCEAHPLLLHMVDVAAVAAHLLTTTLSPALRSRLLSLCPDEEQTLRTLLFLIALHDFGKATPAFQAKAEWAHAELPERGLDLGAPANARHHGDIGKVLLAPVLVARGLRTATANRVAGAVAAHHGEFPVSTLQRRDGISKGERGRKPRWDDARTGIVEELAELFGLPDQLTLRPLTHADVMLLAGLTSVTDWLGSMQEVFAYEPPQRSLPAYWPRALDRAVRALRRAGFRPFVARAPQGFVDLYPTYTPWPLHDCADVLAESMEGPSLTVIEAPMGEGKTEAALLLAQAASARIGQGGLFVGLPTQATANQMFGRVGEYLARVRPDDQTTLLLTHGEASLVPEFTQLVFSGVYGPEGSQRGAIGAESWFLSKKRTLLGEVSVGTVDQALMSVMRVGHGFVRLYGLASKTVVLDEVHAYDTYTSALLDRLVEWLAACGTSVILLSATLPRVRRAGLVEAYGRGAGWSSAEPAVVPYPRVTVSSVKGNRAIPFKPRGTSVRVEVTREPDHVAPLLRRVLSAAAAGACVGWICNTVARAQDVYRQLQAAAPNIDSLLLHSRLFADERRARERRLEAWLGPPRPRRVRPRGCVAVGTQVLEQSLDVDFDLLVSDVAPIDLVLQRAGRLHRHRDRTDRDANQSPRLWLVQPEGTSEDASLDDVAIVYPELLMRRTLEVLDGRDHIVLPDDIEPLVESVYREPLLSEDDKFFEHEVEYLGGAAVERAIASSKLLPRSDIEDDPFGDLQVYLREDDDPLLHAALRPVTRLGRPTLEVVCLDRRPDGVILDPRDGTPLDFDAPPNDELIRRLVLRSIGVSRPKVVHVLGQDPSALPESWRRSSLLRYRRLLAFDDGVAEVDGLRLTVDPDLGLVIGALPTLDL